ncbi:hypothetical protein D3C76_484350 [compost metagenome]
MVRAHLIDNWNKHIQTRGEQPVEFTETLYNSYPLLRYDFDGQCHKYDDNKNNNSNNNPLH